MFTLSNQSGTSLPSPAAIDLDNWARTVTLTNMSIVMLFLLVVAGAVLLAVLIGCIRMLTRHMRNARAAEKDIQAKLRPDGLPYPPSGRGMCDNCQKPEDKIYYMPSGKRLCAECYRILEMPSQKQATLEGTGEGNKGENAFDSC